MSAERSPRFPWPNGARCAVSLSFDVDAESGFLHQGDEWQRRLSSLSQGRYGVVRGVPRILDLLDRHGIRATFFVPGYTAEHHADAIRPVLDAGHEIGHHGYIHKRPDTISAEEEREEMERGLEALQRSLGVRPVGYRSPAWEITPTTVELLNEFDFVYDSSGMGDDVPYLEHSEGRTLLELPVDWLLDDWPQFGFESGSGSPPSNPERVFEIWSQEFDGLYAEGAYFMLTMHPEVIGRPHRIAMLDRLIRHIKGYPGIWWACGEEVARHAAPVIRSSVVL
jgi:peptidoglycan/xylan/chitin deacetylase (PgdA/CDA1 family)